VVGRDADVRRAVLDHLEQHVQHARDGAERRGLALLEAAAAVVMAEELVGAVDEVNDHASLPAFRRLYGNAPA
jgi:hypothetical protein